MLKRIGCLLVFAAVVAFLPPSLEAAPLKTATLDAWLAKYGAAWETRDPAAAGRLFTANATYHEMPFDAPKKGRAAIEEYWKGVTADQRDVKFKYEVIAVDGKTGVAHWSATFVIASTGATLSLDGVFVLEFDSNGECAALREWWHVGGAK